MSRRDGQARRITNDLNSYSSLSLSSAAGALLTGEPHLWIISDAGLNPRQITNGRTESYPSFSPDGKWVAYISIDEIPTLWKVSLDGRQSQPKQLTTNFTWVPSVSPDGISETSY